MGVGGGRMRSLMYIVLLAAFMGSPVTLAQARSSLSELAVRDELDQEAQRMVRARQWTELDARYRQLVDEGTRTPSGIWASGVFMRGIENAYFSSLPTTPEGWDEVERDIGKWLEVVPASGPARLIMANAIVKRAWHIRGDGYARTVPQQAWAPFHAQLRRARDYLQGQEKVVSRYPEYYYTALVIEKGLNDGHANALRLFDEATTRYPGYYPTYFAMLQYLLPKWHGGPSEIETFARQAVERSRGVEGEGMYARIYWYAAQVNYKDDLFLESYARWDSMKAGFEAVLQRYPDQWNLQNYAHFACMAGDAETTATLFDRIETPVIAEAWKGGASFADCERLAGRLRL